VDGRTGGADLGRVLSWAGLDAIWLGWIISESKGERIGIAWGTSCFDAGAMRLGIHESPIV
jgi:hypothetical protein